LPRPRRVPPCFLFPGGKHNTFGLGMVSGLSIALPGGGGGGSSAVP
jgi:hypothetical protein